jgi:glycosyltransferase involved in cell wall biosynthesis
MNVLLVIPEMNAGGAEAVVADLATALVGGGAAVRIASSGGKRTVALRPSGAELVPVPLRRRRDVAPAVCQLRRTVAAAPPDLVSAHNVRAALVARLAFVGSAARRPPIVATMHGVADRAYPAAAAVLRRCADQVVAVSQAVAARLLEAGFPAARLQVIENGIRPVAIHDRAAARARFEVAEAARVVVCIARLAAQKRQDLLVAGWRSVPAGAVLLIAGAGETADRLARQVAALGMGDRIRLLGDRADVDWLLSAADVAVLPTDWEGLPISVLEAMSAGVPVVASAVPGLKGLGAAVELVAPGSAAALAAGVRRLLTDRARAAELSRAGHALVRDRFGRERMHHEYLRCFTAAIAQEEMSG